MKKFLLMTFVQPCIYLHWSDLFFIYWYLTKSLLHIIAMSSSKSKERPLQALLSHSFTWNIKTVERRTPGQPKHEKLSHQITGVGRAWTADCQPKKVSNTSTFLLCWMFLVKNRATPTFRHSNLPAFSVLKNSLNADKFAYAKGLILFTVPLCNRYRRRKT